MTPISSTSLFLFLSSLPICCADFVEFIRSNGGYQAFIIPISIVVGLAIWLCTLACKKKLTLSYFTGQGNRFIEMGGGTNRPQPSQNQQFGMMSNPLTPPPPPPPSLAPPPPPPPPSYSSVQPSGGFSSSFAPPLSGFSNNPYPPPQRFP